MNSLLYRAAESIGSSSSKQRSATSRPDREDRFVLEHYGSRKSLYTDTIIRGNVFKKDRTSLTRACNNLVSKSQFMLQTLQNMAEIQSTLRTQLTIAGIAMRDQGLIYDESFPRPLRIWIQQNIRPHINIVDDNPDDEVDADVMKSTIGQLILLMTVLD